MTKNLSMYFVLGFIFVSVIGTLAHFLYEFSKQNVLVGLISPVNESTWEHMKLIFFPMLMYSLFLIPKLQNNYPCIKSSLFLGIIIGTFLIPILFYTYTGILGYNKLALDISVFIISVLIAFFTAYKLTLSCKSDPYIKVITFCVFILAILFFIYTYFPPQLEIFKEP
ncbi:MAG: DUF6512 family protein [Candidatus Metalachnospira sp.]|nr:DUF6512 family protein [Candidatus Metalachnospira sp.]